MTPFRPPRPCRAACCPELTHRTYCEYHEAKQTVERNERLARRGKTAARGYGSKWQKARDRYIKKYPICEHCGERPSQEVDHMDGDTRNNADWNLQALCKSCHQRKTHHTR